MNSFLDFFYQCSGSVTCQVGSAAVAVLLAAVVSACFIPYGKIGASQSQRQSPDRPPRSGSFGIIVVANFALWGLLIYWLWM